MSKTRTSGRLNCRDVLNEAKRELVSLRHKTIGVLNIRKPTTIDYAKNLAKVISKLSPLIGNMIEFSTVDVLNNLDWRGIGRWVRQDPGFPDATFSSTRIRPNPGIEIKAWFPFATEITARFKDSSKFFHRDNIDMALIAWLPEHVIWGKPKILDVLIVSGKSVAEARDRHYHHPPEYLVLEPEDTASRTANFQQTNTNGYVLQEDKCDVENARKTVEKWGKRGLEYNTAEEYQNRLKELIGKFSYRLDTNYAKIDRIEHTEIEDFKSRVLGRKIKGLTVKQWSGILASNLDDELEESALRSVM